MSHYATISTHALDDVNMKTLQKAVKRINSQFSVKMRKDLKVNVPAMGGNAVLMRGSNPTSIRMNFVTGRKGKTSLSLTGEFYRTGFDLQSFTDTLAKQYNCVRVEQFAKAENLKPLYRKVEENGDIVMRFKVSA